MFQQAKRSSKKGIREDSWFAIGWHGDESHYTDWKIGPFILSRRIHPKYNIADNSSIPLYVDRKVKWQFNFSIKWGDWAIK